MNRILSIDRLDRYGHPTGEKADFPGENAPSGRKRGSGRVLVTPEEGEAFTISERALRRLGLSEGEELSQDLYGEIMQTLRASCMQRCGVLLGKRDYPVSRLQKKLQDAGFPGLVVEDCIARLREARYLDDGRYAQNYVRAHLQDRSRLRIRMDLKDRGIEEGLIEEAFAECAGEMNPDQVQMAQICRLLRKRGYRPQEADFALKQKTMAFLYRRGYERELICRAMEDPELILDIVPQ